MSQDPTLVTHPTRAHGILRTLARSTAGLSALLAVLFAATPVSAQSQSNSVTVTINLTITATATVDTAKVQAATKSAIQAMLAQRANVLASTGPDTARMHARLSGGSLFGSPSSETAGAGAGAGASASLGSRTGFAAQPNRGGVLDRYGMGASTGSAPAGGNGPHDSPDRRALFTSPFDRFGRGGTNSGSGPSINDAPALPFGMRREYDAAAPERRAAPLGFRFSGDGDDNGGRFQFATSLSQFRAAAEEAQRAKQAALDPTAGFDRTALRGAPASRPATMDVWLEGSSTYYKTGHPDGRRHGHAGVVLAGVDMLARPWLLVGALAQLDWLSDSADVNGLPRDGRGWMAGPYMSARLTPNLYFDARGAWGRSTNHIDPTGGAVDTFETTRSILSAKLTGDWSRDAWRLRPSAELVWFKETQAEYTNALGIAIASNTAHLGRLTAGPEVGYQIKLADGSVIEPFVGVKAVWDFAVSEQVTSTGAAIGHDGLRARLEGGVAVRLPAGMSLRMSGSYDGWGSDGYRALQGQARIVVPLQ